MDGLHKRQRQPTKPFLPTHPSPLPIGGQGNARQDRAGQDRTEQGYDEYGCPQLHQKGVTDELLEEGSGRGTVYE